jgi:hypothetical protein
LWGITGAPNRVIELPSQLHIASSKNLPEGQAAFPEGAAREEQVAHQGLELFAF